MTTPADTTLRWEVAVPLASNRYMLAGLAKATLGGAALVTCLVTILLAIQGEWQAMPRIAALLAMIGLGLLAIGVLVMVAIFRNHLRLRFTVDNVGVTAETVDRVAKTGNRAALLVGLVLGRPAAAASGLLATQQELQQLHWKGAFRAELEPATHSIALLNGWRTLLRIYCLPGNYELVTRTVSSFMTTHGTARRGSTKSPLARYLWRTAAVTLAALPALVFGDVYGVGLLLPFLLLCFAIAMVWLVRGLAWVVLLAAVSTFGAMAFRLLILHSTGAGYRALSGDDWALSALATLGLLIIVAIAIAVIRGRIQPALVADEQDGSG